MEQMRDYDFVSFEHDTMVGLGAMIQDILSGLSLTVVAGLAGTQTGSPSLSINIGAGRVYTVTLADAVATGSIPQDTTLICQQGQTSGQQLTLVPPTAGQSQWNLIQCQFSQVDAVRANDPNQGIVPFYNASNPTVPNPVSINTVRQGLLVLQVLSGPAATTGSEVPPTPTNGWVPLYLIDLVGGQGIITTAQILKAGPTVGTGVPPNYPSAPFLAGMLMSHHSGTPGQAPKINLATEVQGVLSYANMSPTRQLLGSALTLYVNSGTGSDANSGLSPSSPFKTIQACINAGYHNYDFNGNSLTISVANGTYATTQSAGQVAISINAMPLGCPTFSIVGNNASPGNVALSVTGGTVFNIIGGTVVSISGMAISASGTNTGLNTASGYGMNVAGGSIALLSNIIFGSCGTIQAQASNGGLIQIIGPLTCSGSTVVSFQALYSGTIYNITSTVTVTGLVVSGAFVQASQNGTVVWFTGAFTGTATGPRYSSDLNGVINTNGSGVNYFPGNSAGVAQRGGQYV